MGYILRFFYIIVNICGIFSNLLSYLILVIYFRKKEVKDIYGNIYEKKLVV